MDEENKLPIGIYARVSTDDQNIEQQIKLLKDFAKSKGFYIRTYSDYAISGTIADRPQWQKLIADIEAGKILGLVVSKFDRITRDLKYSLEFLEIWKKSKFKLLSIYDGEFRGTPDDYFTFKLKCLLSEYELQQLAWRRQIGIERKKAEGGYKGRKKGTTNRKYFPTKLEADLYSQEVDLPVQFCEKKLKYFVRP